MPESKNSRWKIFTEQLRNKYRLVILNDDSFAEKFALRLSPLGLIILLGAITIMMTTFVISIVAFTPLREYIPGYGNVNDRKDLLSLSARADSLEKTLEARDWYMDNILKVFEGQVEGKPAKPSKDSTGKYNSLDTKPSAEDVKLRTDIETNQLASTSDKVSANKIGAISHFFFFTPVKGIVTTSYNMHDQHYGVDIVAKQDELVKATLDGTVLFSGFTSDDGYVIQIQHANNLTSVYKHNASVTKRTGDYVKAGEPISVIGNTGENSSGPHLHFEIWYNGLALNPQDYVVF